YKDPEDDIEKCLQNINAGNKIVKKSIKQQELLINVANWNFIKNDRLFMNFYDTYKINTESISIYYDHLLAENKFKNKFYFDGSFNIPTKDILESKMGTVSCWEVPSIKSRGFLSSIIGYFPKNKKIKIAEGSQGMIMLNTRYKIIWRYVNPDKFLFIEGENVFPRFQQFCIASNSKNEIFYLLSILNSKITTLLINNLLRSENEKDLLLGLSVIKEFIRVPKITKENQFIKDEIINKTEEMLKLENVLITDLVDFDRIMQQKFDDVKIEGNNLVLITGDKQIKCKIREGAKLVKKTIEDKYVRDKLFKDKIITLSELKSLPVIDFEKQKEIKDYIDDLVFALYFNVQIKKVGLNKAKEIEKECEKNKFYKLVKQED
ncbi:MAG: hypothetical protein NT116_04750, partial [Candidatus Parcubacteria bacterium]|nr:hypothetical protein [Candidatus Parcubacteria bacterium]